MREFESRFRELEIEADRRLEVIQSQAREISELKKHPPMTKEQECQNSIHIAISEINET